ncbi:oligoribonuclease [Corynebacterium genitalium ATCC 33030]|uniref:Oligoribonuclease n=1 Tax=Corynebacterium genitalium ATCC 33030 TaxID=585529 RepID=D7WC11_9CORY|nr:oligoribonuclease [Corynebacterium genitalium]EFK54640.1 exonuclease [Corynebacterium genitalium ATCC 33030]UUA89034.1 oligoribonuclease [Corynebacterium genitalium ATCC 33030]
MSEEPSAEPTTLPAKDDRIVWIDLEMTGLDPQRHVIVEVAALVTDAELNILDGGIDLVVHATDAELAEMDDFVTEMHGSSGLTEQIKASTVALREAEEAVLELVDKHCGEHRPPLAGNSIATDRTFIRAHMPELDERLHYRMIDVSTIKELTRRWYPKAYYNQPGKGMAHRALADIVESIRELDYYRRAVFVAAPGPESTAAATCATKSTETYQPFL